MNPETRALQQKLADINSLLATVELNHFAQSLIGKELLSYQSMNSILSTLGYSKAHQASQLMESVMAQVKVTPRKFEHFVTILSEDPSLQHLTEELMKTYRNLGGKLGGKLVSIQWDEPARSGSGTIEPDLPTLLNEVAAVIPAKWRAVGNLLKVPKGVLDGMERQYSPLECFERVLTEWRSRGCSPYTWDSIISVLRSPAVAEVTLANELAAKCGLSPRKPSFCNDQTNLSQMSAPCAPPRPNQRPTLAELQSITVNGEIVSIIRTVAGNWKTLCVAFNFDPQGRQLKVIEQRYPNQSEECCREMFQTWLKIPGVSWSSLITVLESCEEPVIAEHVKAYVGIGAQQKGADGARGDVPVVQPVGCGVPARGGDNGNVGTPKVLPSGEKAFKMCYSELFKGITNEQADFLIADLFGNDLLTPSERDQLYDVPIAQKNRQLLSAVEKHITSDPTRFYTLLEVLESDEVHLPLTKKLRDKISKS